MKTIIARFGEMKKAVGDSVEIEGELVDVNKVDTALKSIGVQLRDGLTGQFRDLDDVFLELSSKWDTLDRNTQRYVATIAAGSRQQSRFLALMDNYERTIELVEIAQNSTGASTEQFGKTMDSIDTKINQLKSNFEEFIGLLSDSNLIKGTFEVLNNLFTSINNIAEDGVGVLGIFLTMAIINIRKLVNSIITGAKQSVQFLQAGMNKVSGAYGENFREENEKAVQDLIQRFRDGRLKQAYRSVLTGETQSAAVGGPLTDFSNIKGSQRRKDAKILSRMSKTARAGKAGVFLGLEESSVAARYNIATDNLEDFKKQTDDTSKSLKKFNKQSMQGAINAVSNFASMAAGAASMIATAVYAADSSKAAEGATVGGTVGGALGSIGYIWGPAIGAAASAIGSFLGTFIGGEIGQWSDSTLGFASEVNIKKLSEEYELENEKLETLKKEHSEVLKNADAYKKLAEATSLTVEEREQLNELTDEYIKLFPELELYRNVGIGDDDVLNEQIKNRIELAEQEIQQQEQLTALTSARKEAASKLSSFLNQGVDKYIENPAWYEWALGAVGALSTLGFIGLEGVSPGAGHYLTYEGAGLATDYLSGLSQRYYGRERLIQWGRNVRDGTAKNSSYDAYLEYANENGEVEVIDEDQYDEFMKDFNEAQDAMEAQFTQLTSIYGSTITKLVSNFESDFAKDNQSLLSSLYQAIFEDEELKKEYMQGDKTLDEIQAEIDNKFQEVTNIINENIEGLDAGQQYSLNELFSLAGLYGGEIPETERYGKEIYNSFNAIWENLPEATKAAYIEAFSTLGSESADAAKKIFEKYGKEYGAAVSNYFVSIIKQIETNNGPDSIYAKAFEANYKELLNFLQKEGRENELGEVVQLIGNTDIDNLMSISKLFIKLEEKDIPNAGKMIENFGDTASMVGFSASEALQLINNELSKVSKMAEMAGDAIDGSLSLENFAELQELLISAGKDPIALEDIFLSTDGIGIRGGIENDIADLASTFNKASVQAAARSYLEYENNREIMKSYEGQDLSDPNSEAYQNYQTALLNAQNSYAAYTTYGIAPRVAELERTKEQIETDKDRLKNIKDLIASMNRYYNLEREALRLNNEADQLAVDLDFSTSADEAADILKRQTLNLVKQQELLAKKGEFFRRDMDEFGEYINSTYSEFLTVGEDGNIRQNNEALLKLIQKMSNATGSEKEKLQLLYDSVVEVQGAYEEMYDNVAENAKEQKENLIAQRELEEEHRQYIIDVQEALQDIILRQAREEVEAVKEKYDKIKKEDDEYLKALKKSIDKRKQLQSQEDEDNEIEKLQKRIALLSRDTSGIYAKEIQDLQEELRTKQRDRTNNALDRMYEEEEERLNQSHTTMDNKLAILQDKLTEEEKTLLETNQRVASIMAQGYDTVLSFLVENNEKYASMTKEQQESFVFAQEQMVAKAMGAQQKEAEDLEKQKNAMKGMFDDLVVNGPGKYTKAIDDLNSKTLTLNVDLQEAYDELQTFIDQVQEAKDQLEEIERKIKEEEEEKQKREQRLKEAEDYFYDMLALQGEDGFHTKVAAGEVKKLGGNIDPMSTRYQYAISQKLPFIKKKYATGGMVDYTGPAWVDGTPSKPEAFLSASDTENIARLRDVLQSVFSSNISNGSDSTDEKFGDTYYEFHINIDQLDEGYDAEQMMKDMEKYILQKASYRKVTNVSRR